MKRLCSLAALMVLASSACSAEPISFSVGGHRVRIEAPRNCRSTSCASVSVSGLLESRRRRNSDDDRDVAPPPTPAPAPAPAQISPPSAPPPVSLPQNKPIIAAAPPPPPAAPPASVPAVGFTTAAASTRPALPPFPPVPPPPRVESSQPASQPCVAPPAEKPIEAAPAKPPLIKALHEEDSDTPLGDWQTENRGVVRIAQCGSALCGYTLNASSNDKGEAVLINMKPKTDTRWTGSVYSRDSGDTYYGTVDLKGPNTLRVEACAFSRFYCSGNNWIRISTRPMVTSRQIETRPRS
jgi:Uncharacterized protein conserved in bacteria (DUF2147)